jgi:uncharacterized membrane protein SpoIIM required for sporulation
MIIDLPRFIQAERHYWTQLEACVARLEDDAVKTLSLTELQRLHYLYERAAADLARINTFASEPDLRRYLENLVSRAYAEIHETRGRGQRLALSVWFTQTFPRTLRAHSRALWLSCAVTLAGTLFGLMATLLDPQSRFATMPFGHDQMRPRERVAMEEQGQQDRIAGGKASFSSFLMANNTKVSIFTMALGITYGVGTLVMLFYNGIGLGAIGIDYILDGQGLFLAGWLLPHGSVEIPAILIAGQAGLVLAGALIGRGQRNTVSQRLRDAGRDMLALIGGVAVLLVWAGIVEGFFSQYHEPVVPYWLKIAFGATQLALLILFLARAGRAQTSGEPGGA